MEGAGGMLRYPPQMQHGPPISRTLQYKKITKPLLERKRRARINRCLEQLKDLMVGALETEGENINKLEKADILELTVRHLHRITRPHNPTEEVQRFQAGFTQCASEACGFLLSLPGLDNRVGKRLVEHLGKRISQSLESNPSLIPGQISHPVNNAGGLLAISQSPDQVVYKQGGNPETPPPPPHAGASPQLLPGNAVPNCNPGISPNLATPNNPYQFAYYDTDFRARSQSDRRSLPVTLSPRETLSKQMPRSSSLTTSDSSCPSSSFTNLMCPKPTRPISQGITAERPLSIGITMTSQRRSLSPDVSISSSLLSPATSIASARHSLSQLSPSVSITSVGHLESQNDRASPALSTDGNSSCHSEDMWRPW